MLSAITTLTQVVNKLPNGKEKQEITENLEKAKHQFKLAEVQTLRGLGYELCRNHGIPEIMLSKDDLHWECPACGNKKYTGTTAAWLE